MFTLPGLAAEALGSYLAQRCGTNFVKRASVDPNVRFNCSEPPELLDTISCESNIMIQTYQFFHIFARFGFTAATPARLLDVRFTPKS